MKKILFFLFIVLSIATNAQHVRVNQIKSTGQPEGKIVVTDGTTEKLKISTISIGDLGAGTVTNVTATSPILSSGGTQPNISIQAATATQTGSMSASDKAKLDGDTDQSPANELNTNIVFNVDTKELSITDAGGTRSATIDINVGNAVNSYVGKIDVVSSTISVTWPDSFSTTNYFLRIDPYYVEIIGGKSIRISNAVYDFVKTVSGFSLKVDTVAGFVEYFAADTTNIYPIEFGNYVEKNGTITPATNTKITYDAKGLVTGSTSATATDIVNTPFGTITDTTVQGGINSLDTKKVPYTGATGNVDLGNYAILAKGQQLPISNGACQISSLTNNGDGTVTLGSGDYHLSSFVNGKGSHNYTLAGGTFSLTDLTTNYLVADYNSGNPIIRVITDVSLINETTIVPIYTIYRNGTYLHTQNWDSLGLALANKVHQSIVKTQRYRRESGLSLSEYGTRNLNLTSGIIWTGAVPITLDAIATATDNLFFWYHSGGNWTSSIETQYNNTQYDNGTNLATLTVNRYAVNWIYRGVESKKHLYVILGGGDYTLAQAQSASVPIPPIAISSHAVLVGKLIVQNGATTATSIQSAFDTQFSLATPTDHNSLTGLQGGATSEYFHLSDTEHTVATQAATSTLNGYLTASDWINFRSAYIHSQNDADTSISNEGLLTVGAGGSNSSTINSNTDGSSAIIIAGGTNVNVSESGNTITISATGGSSATGEIWTALTGTYASATTFTFSGTDKDARLVEMSLLTCTNSTGATRRIGYVKTATNSSGTITCNVVTDTDLASGDKDFKIAYNRKVTDYMRLITIPGEQIADASYSQGMFYSDIQTASYLLPVDASVLTAAAGTGAALTWNVYKGATNLFSSAPDMTTNTVLRSQRPTTNTISAADNVSLRILTSAGATNKAADFQAKLYIIPQSIFTAF